MTYLYRGLGILLWLAIAGMLHSLFDLSFGEMCGIISLVIIADSMTIARMIRILTEAKEEREKRMHKDYDTIMEAYEANSDLDVIKEKKGLRHNTSKLRWRNFPMFLMEPVIEVGAKAEKTADNPEGKYPTFNFLNGLEMNDTLDSLKRHLMKFESPYHSDIDEESQCNHLAHIAWNALVALHMLKTRSDLDDRFKLPEPKVEEKK